MKVFLVGGAVRDKLLNYPVVEKDYVVTGATKEQMLALGYQQVGKDFPVFLHPDTKEEYALARTERKSGSGYYGFDVNVSAHVTLEQDLLRRDLTINAMAMDEQGKLIDPYDGQSDLKAKKLRHVSPAFSEDPVRVLRIARFLARYHHLGFRIADDTRLLMAGMVRSGELHSLVPERVWQECQRALEEKNPEQFFLALRSVGALAVIFPEIDRLFGIPNAITHHPEIDSGIHTLYTLQACCQLSQDNSHRFAALVHDLGKAVTKMDDWPRHPDHDEAGVPVIETFCQRLRVPSRFQSFAILVCRFHLMIHRIERLTAEQILTVLNQTDAFRRSQRFEALLLVCQADINGTGAEKAYPQRQKWQFVLTECAKITHKEVVAQGFQHEQIKQEVDVRRRACITLIQSTWKKNEKK